LVSAAIEEMRRRSVIVPRLPVLERLCARTALRAQRQLFATLSANLTDNQRRQLDAVLEPHGDRQLSVLAWLRSPSGIPSPRTMLTHIERLQRIREIELSPELGAKAKVTLFNNSTVSGDEPIVQIENLVGECGHRFSTCSLRSASSAKSCCLPNGPVS
jgi:hypothetical protein